jgi:hypothetical protein
VVFWVVALCSLVVGNRHFGGRAASIFRVEDPDEGDVSIRKKVVNCMCTDYGAISWLLGGCPTQIRISSQQNDMILCCSPFPRQQRGEGSQWPPETLPNSLAAYYTQLHDLYKLKYTPSPNGSRDSWVGIELGYRLDDRGSRVRFPAGAGNFYLHHRVQNGSGAHPASYQMSTWGSFPRGKAAGAWSWSLAFI